MHSSSRLAERHSTVNVNIADSCENGKTVRSVICTGRTFCGRLRNRSIGQTADVIFSTASKWQSAVYQLLFEVTQVSKKASKFFLRTAGKYTAVSAMFCAQLLSNRRTGSLSVVSALELCGRYGRRQITYRIFVWN
jgi:hypothetical protein